MVHCVQSLMLWLSLILKRAITVVATSEQNIYMTVVMTQQNIIVFKNCVFNVWNSLIVTERIESLWLCVASVGFLKDVCYNPSHLFNTKSVHFLYFRICPLYTSVRPVCLCFIFFVFSRFVYSVSHYLPTFKCLSGPSVANDDPWLTDRFIDLHTGVLRLVKRLE